MKYKALIFWVLIISLISYFFIQMYPFAKGVAENIKPEKIKDSVFIIKKTELKDKIKPKNILNLRNELKLKYGGEFMIAYHSKKKILSLLNYKNLFNPFPEKLNKSLVNFNVSRDENSDIVYSKNYSKITIYSYQNEMYENTEYEIVGKLFEKNLILTNNVKIGMSKIEFLNKFFELEDKIVSEIKQVSIGKDERGETYTKYRFENGKLIGISFGDNEEFSLMKIQKNQFPKWLMKLFPKEIYKGEITQKVISYNKLNDSISYAIIEQTSGVGSKKYLETFNKSLKINSLNLSSHIDADLSMSEYSYKYYKFEDNKFKITDIIETAIDSEFQQDNEKSLDEVETKIDTIIKTYQININGKIIETIK